jgi:hypothetical protein
VFAAEPLGQTLNTYGKVDRLLHKCFDQSEGTDLPRFAGSPTANNAVLEGRRGVDEQPIQSAVKFVHGSIASRANSI